MNNRMSEDQAVFEELRRLPPGSERDACLQQRCGNDTDMRHRIATLLGSYDQARSFLEVPPPGLEPETMAIEVAVTAEKARHELPDRTIGHYQVLEMIGEGGMGRVVKAHDSRLNRVVAIKLLHPTLASNGTARARFIREAQAAAAVSHDHVVSIYGVDEADGIPYLVMEFVEGQSLQERIERDGPLELKEILRIGMQTAAGLAAAHAQGLVHRDIKPANILMENGVERVKITDFGLARAVDDTSLTQTGIVAGTPQYMAPEQARGEPVDHRADLFSLGSVLYAMCVGKAPFRAPSTVATLREVCDKRPEPIRALNPDVPQWLVQVIDKLHAKNPADRFQCAREVADLLAAALAELQQPTAGGVSHVLRNLSKSVRRPTTSRRLAVIAATLLVLLAGFGISESLGVTSVFSTMVRIVQGEGVLVLEVDDPGLQVRIEEADVELAGTDLQALRLRPGEYTVRATKDGQSVQEIVVRLARGGREVVSFGREPPSQAAPAPLKPAPLAKGVAVAQEVGRLEGHSDVPGDLQFTPDGKKLLTAGGLRREADKHVAGSDFSVRLWDVESRQQLHKLEGHTSPVNALAISADGRTALSAGKQLLLWDLQTGKLLREFDTGGANITSLAFVPNTDWVLLGAFGWAALGDLNTGHRWRMLANGNVHAVAVTPDGRLAAVGGDNDGVQFAAIHDLETFAAVELEGLSGTARGLAFTSDGRRLVAGTWDGIALTWDTTTGALLQRLDLRDGANAGIVDLALTSDNRHLLTAGWGTATGLRLVDLKTRETPWYVHGFQKNVALSPDQRLAASTSWEDSGTVHLWELPQALWARNQEENTIHRRVH